MKRALLTALLCASLISSAQGSTAFDPPTSQQYALVNRVNYVAANVVGGSTFTTLASPTLTLGTSAGPTGAWAVEVVFQYSTKDASATTSCITGTNAGTSAAGSYDAPNAAICAHAPANPLAGASENSTQNPYVIRYTAQYANGATVAFACKMWFAGSNEPTSGYCNERAWAI
jgi:hypothetical protein